MSVDRRKLIIDAATRSFSMFGYKATTMDQVSKLANVGKGTIYTFFKNKEELFEDIIATLVRDIIVEADSMIIPNATFVENVHRILFQILKSRKEHVLMIKLLQEEKELGTPAVLDMLQHIEKEIISYLKKRIEGPILKKQIIPCDPELTSFLLLKTYIALVSDWEKNHDPLSSEQIAEVLDQYFIKGLSI
jgi:AcrR family transcriptional regulator